MYLPPSRQLEITYKDKDGEEHKVTFQNAAIESMAEGVTFRGEKEFTITFISAAIKISRWKRIVTFIKNLFKRK